jgi:glycosyltransferase involved in cell wall biosynthesis
VGAVSALEAYVAAPRPLTIFVPHASDLLTDHQAHGDGLVAFEIVARLAERGHRVHVAAPAVDVKRRLPDNLRTYAVAVKGGTSLAGRLAYMLAVRRLYERILRHEPIDVVHQLNPVFTGISLALRGTRAPRVLGSFVADWPGERSGGSGPVAAVKRRVAALQQRDAAALLVTTPAARERIVERGRNADKIVTIPHGVDARRFSAAPHVAQPPTILFLGGLERRKGIFTLIDAFALVHAILPEAVLVVAGFGREWPRVTAAVAAAGLGERVRFLGAIGREAVPRVIAESTVVCVPSYGEPFGMALLEAMASAKPVVATDVGGAAHLLNPCGGRKVPPHAPGALADALLEILRSPSLAARMGRHNRKLAEERYSWDSVIDRLESVYADVLERGCAR